MQFFLDTANFEEIVEGLELGVISGVTTNPSLVAKEEGQDFLALVKKLAETVPGPVSAEVLALSAQEMIAEAQALVRQGANVVIKIPMTKDGLKAVSALGNQGIKTNVTLIYSVNQALLAASDNPRYRRSMHRGGR
jgi:transaldolase